MDYVKKFDLELDREFYYAGERLTGRVLIDTTENMRIQCIRVALKARVHVEWRVTRGSDRRLVKEDDILMDNKAIVWGKEPGPGESATAANILPRGFHQYFFEFQIPESALPCSFESKNGTIRYYLKVVIDIPYASSPQGIKYFTLIGPYIDCIDEKYLTQLRADEKITKFCLCCRQVPIAMEAVLERSAYCSGEKVRLCGSVTNNSSQVAFFIVRLFQNVDYIASKTMLTATKSVEHKVLEYVSPPIKSKTKADFVDFDNRLEVPVMPPTLVNVCRNIEITYALKVIVSTKKVESSDIEVDFPFTVASVPYRIPNKPMPQITYAECAKHVEGGMYVSPEFQLGQVYDGTVLGQGPGGRGSGNSPEFHTAAFEGGGGHDDFSSIVLYRPVYTTTFMPSEETAAAMALVGGGGGGFRHQGGNRARQDELFNTLKKQSQTTGTKVKSSKKTKGDLTSDTSAAGAANTKTMTTGASSLVKVEASSEVNPNLVSPTTDNRRLSQVPPPLPTSAVPDADPDKSPIKLWQ